MSLVVGTLNAHNERGAVRYMLRQRCDVLGLSEVNQLDAMLARSRRYRVTVGAAGRDKRRGASDNPILTKRAHYSLGSIAWQSSEQSKPERIAPDRWVTIEAMHVAKLGHVAVINVHPNAVTDDRTTDVPRVRESAELWATVDRLLTFCRDEGLLVVLTGDLNARKSADTPGWEGAYDVLKAQEMSSVSVGLDVIAFDKRLRKIEQRVIDRETTGSDHPGIIVKLDRRL